MDVTVQGLDDTRKFAVGIVGALKNAVRVRGGSVILTLSGPLGAGKTAFVKCLADLLGVSDTVTSPSFVIRSDYETADDVFSSLIHIDVYRFEDSSEIKTIGWSDVLNSAHTLVVVEWPERIREYIPDGAHSVSVRFSGTSRVFSTNLLTTLTV